MFAGKYTRWVPKNIVVNIAGDTAEHMHIELQQADYTKEEMLVMIQELMAIRDKMD